MVPLRVAIIGGGISGLAAAWNLKIRQAQCPTQITVFEAGSLGGNCVTDTFHAGDLFRWCDLGVNDFNANTYVEVVNVMDLLGVEYKPLEDTACFFNADNSVVYTIGGPRDIAMSGSLAAEYRHFKMYAAGDLQKNYATMSQWTIAQYLQYRSYSANFMHLCILPRVNAMYFCADEGAANMPFAAIMRYYVLQEGFGKAAAPQRMYFVNGSQRWIDALAKTLSKDYGVTIVSGQGNAAVVPGSDPQDPLMIGTAAIAMAPFDICITACQADDALAAINSQLLTPAMQQALGTVKYTSSLGVVHTDSRLLPANRNAWRTYNIRIRDESQPINPYQMTYVENRHQNDAAGIFDHYGLSEFFVSINPYISPMDDLIIQDPAGNPITQTFKHNVLDLATMQMQTELPTIQGTNNLYFAGGWTRGAGLHIECWTASDAIARQIVAQKSVAAAPMAPKAAVALSIEQLSTQEMPSYFKRGIDPMEDEAPALEKYPIASIVAG